MADKKTFKDMTANLPTTTTDMSKVMVQMADGSVGWIRKEDLAQVAAELIGTATTEKDGLMPSSFQVRTFSLLNKHVEFSVPMYAPIGLLLFLYNTGATNVAVLNVNSFNPNFSFIHYFGNEARFSIYYKDGKFYIQGTAKANSGANIKIANITDSTISYSLKDGTFDITDAQKISEV